MVNRVLSRPDAAEPKVVADMSHVKSNPYNLVGCNITSLYGGMINRETWRESQYKLMDPEKKLKKMNSSYVTSCDESDSKLVQRYDDDKLELTCYSSAIDMATFASSRFG